MRPDELETYLDNIVTEFDGTLIEMPGDTYYKVDVTPMVETDDDYLEPDPDHV